MADLEQKVKDLELKVKALEKEQKKTELDIVNIFDSLVQDEENIIDIEDTIADLLKFVFTKKNKPNVRSESGVVSNLVQEHKEKQKKARGKLNPQEKKK